MKIPFRQGIVRYQKDNTGNQTFLQKASTGNGINLLANTDPTLVTIAQRKNNYLIEERVTVLNAWTNFAAGTDYWLFLDIDMVTGVRTFGSTLVEPKYGPIAPLNPQIDQHWFDTNSLVMCMKVYNGVTFVEKLRVFLAKYQQGATIIPMMIGSQIAQNIVSEAGAILFDADGSPVRKMFSRTHNEFFTTATIFTSNASKSVNVTLDALCTTVDAGEPIPAFSLVAHGASSGEIVLADPQQHNRSAVGIVQEDFYNGETGIYSSQGYIYNEQWNWTSLPGTPVFLGPSGTIVTTPTQYHTIQQVGEIVTAQMIRLNISPSIQFDSIMTDYKNLAPISLDKTTGKYIATSVDVPTEAQNSRTGFAWIQTEEATTWTVAHNRSTFRYLIQVFDADGEVVYPNTITTIDSNTIELTFTAPQAGHASVVFFNADIVQVNYDITLSALSTFNADETLLIQPLPINAILRASAEGCKAVVKTPDNAELYIKIDGETVGTIVFTEGSNTGTFIIPQDITINESQVLEIVASPTISALANVGALIRLQNIGTL